MPNDLWMTSNSRLNRFERARRTRALREQAGWTGRAARVPRLRRAHIKALIQYPTNAKADPQNAEPTVKPIIDGLVDVGLLPDDNHEHLEGPDLRRADGLCARGFHKVFLVVTDLGDELTGGVSVEVVSGGVQLTVGASSTVLSPEGVTRLVAALQDPG